MLVLARAGTLTVKFGTTLDPADADRLSDTISAFAPVAVLTLDFRQAGPLRAEDLVLLARALRPLDGVRVLVRSMSWAHLRVLRLLGVPAEPVATNAGLDSHHA